MSASDDMSCVFVGQFAAVAEIVVASIEVGDVAGYPSPPCLRLPRVIQMGHESLLGKLTPCVNTEMRVAFTQKAAFTLVNAAKIMENDRRENK
jgi:hypothetical protein